MAVIEVVITSALICFGGECYPALVGSDTPRGSFQTRLEATRLRGYGGDILTFHEDHAGRYAIHRTWQGRETLYSAPPARRRTVTKGCINVTPEVYARLVECCAGAEVVVR